MRVHTGKLSALLAKGWSRTDGTWVHKTAARESGLPGASVVVRKYPWERRGARAPKLLASFSGGPQGFAGLETGGDTRAEAASALIRLAMAATLARPPSLAVRQEAMDAVRGEQSGFPGADGEALEKTPEERVRGSRGQAGEQSVRPAPVREKKEETA